MRKSLMEDLRETIIAQINVEMTKSNPSIELLDALNRLLSTISRYGKFDD